MFIFLTHPPLSQGEQEILYEADLKTEVNHLSPDEISNLLKSFKSKLHLVPLLSSHCPYPSLQRPNNTCVLFFPGSPLVPSTVSSPSLPRLRWNMKFLKKNKNSKGCHPLLSKAPSPFFSPLLQTAPKSMKIAVDVGKRQGMFVAQPV